MKLKRVIAFIILIVTLFTLTGCIDLLGTEVTMDCVTYKKYETNGSVSYKIKKINTTGTDDTLERIYVRDEINGKKVVGVSGYFAKLYVVTVKNTERIYFPWSLSGSYMGIGYRSIETKIKYAIHPSYDVHVLGHGDDYNNVTFVITKELYDKGGFPRYRTFVPANIAYFFNYTDSPNGGYFFVDIEEQTGKIIKPPYDPKREGYTFTGWYKDAECTEKWNFKEDNVVVNYDEEGDRIFEELCLYAGWNIE